MWPIALFYKELRQLQGILLLGLVAVILTLLQVSRDQTASGTNRLIPFCNDTIDFQLTLVACCLAIVIGFWQTLSETYRGTWLFLLHRPISRASITLTKLGSGLLLVSLVVWIPLLISAIYFSQPGVIAAPFQWNMFNSVWKNTIFFVPFYLAAYLAGLRKSRWYFSRLFPLASVFCFYALAFFIFPEDRFPSQFIAICLTCGILIVSILQQLDQEDYS